MILRLLPLALILSLTAPEREADDRAEQPPAPVEREDWTLVAWYRSIYAPRAGGAYDSHHRTAGIAGRTRRHGGCVAACGAVSITNKNLIFGTHRPSGAFRTFGGIR